MTFRHLTRTTSSTVQSTRRTLTSTFQDYHILQWNDHMASIHVRNLIQKIENHPHRHALQSDLQQHRQFNPFKAKNHETSLKHWTGTLRCICRTGTSALSVARAGTESSTPQAPAREEARGSRVLHRDFSSRRNARRENSWAFTIGSSVMQDSEGPWLNWVALKKWFVRWTN